MKSKITIKGNKKYLTYLGKHLQKEHPKTKGNIFMIKNQKGGLKYGDYQ